jgi:DNA-binding protein H-NS
MARKSNFASMSVEQLMQLRDTITAELSRKASDLKNQLARLVGDDRPRRGRPPGSGRKSLRGRKVAPKYRGPGGETWSGRGLKPRWLVAEMKKGKKLESFAIK